MIKRATLLLALCLAAAQARLLAVPPPACKLEPFIRDEADVCKLYPSLNGVPVVPCASQNVAFVAQDAAGYGGGYPGQLGPACDAAPSVCESNYAPHHPLACVACKACSAVQALPSGWCLWQKANKQYVECDVPYPGRSDWFIACANDGPHVMPLGGADPPAVPADVAAAINAVDFTKCY